MGGQSSSSQTSQPQFQTFPGAFGYGQSAGLMNQAQGIINQQSPYSGALQQSILNPQFGPATTAESNLLNSLMDLTSGRTASRGLGAPTQESLAAGIAPEMVGLQQSQIQNLMGGQGLTQALQGQNLNALLNMVGLAMPQVVGGNVTKGTSSGWKIL